MPEIFRKLWVRFALAGAVVVIVAVLFFGRDKGPKYELVKVLRGEVIQEVSVTGRVEPAESVELAFEVSGRVSGVNAEVGKSVFRGEVLAALDNSELTTELNKAESDLNAQSAKLAEANTTLANLYAGALNVLNEAYLKADDAVRVKTNSLFSGSRQSAYTLTFSACGSQAKTDSVDGRLAAEGDLENWQRELSNLTKEVNFSLVDAALESGRRHLIITANFLDSLNKAINADCLLGETSLDSERVDLNTARTDVRAALTAISDKEQAIALQKAVISSQEATEKSYGASVANIKAQLAKTRLYSPINGLVTLQNAKRGEIVTARNIIVSVISAAEFQIEANVPEVDIAKVKFGQGAKVTLDAYGPNVIFEAVVSEIEPAETVIEGVPTYKTTFQFKEKDERIKSGLTANIDILTARYEKVLYIPQRALITKDGRSYVRFLKDGAVGERDVTAGLRGSDGSVEVTIGLNEGEEVVVFEK